MGLLMRNGIEYSGGGSDGDVSVYGVFIDTSRVVYSSFVFDSSAHTWTATEDCILTDNMSPPDSTTAYFIRIDGKQVFAGYSTVEDPFVYVKKGQVVEYRAKSGSTMKAYAIQQGTNGIFAPVIYSDTERVIGVWRDNKPLYQKTINCGTLPNSSNKTISTPSNLENLIDAFGFAYSISDPTYQRLVPFSAGGTNDIRVDLSNSVITITTFSNWSGYTGYLTIQYTKTTDVAGSGSWNTDGVPTHHYSTNEQVIGTWIDGKPLYEKTWDFSGSPVSLVYNTWVDSGIEASTNIDTLVNSFLRYGALTCMGVEVGKGAGGFTIGLNKYENLNTRGVTQITLQYTKTTD